MPRRPLFPFILDSPLNPTITGSIQVSNISLLCVFEFGERDRETSTCDCNVHVSSVSVVHFHVHKDRPTDRTRERETGREGGGERESLDITFHTTSPLHRCHRPEEAGWSDSTAKRNNNIHNRQTCPRTHPKKNQVQACAQIQQMWYIFVCMRAYTGMCSRVDASKIE